MSTSPAAPRPGPALFSVGLIEPKCPHSMVYVAFAHYAGADRTMTVWSLTGSGSTNTGRLRRSTGGGRPVWTNVVAGAAASFLCHFCETRQPPARRRPLEGNTGSIFQNG
ncbi:hypothetical protein [Streptomyces mirabilis]|uniref:hypothetical protein n=1 Tax=Streptomyces mirabilis TaxID=68239 RepID=UPI0036466E6F